MHRGMIFPRVYKFIWYLSEEGRKEEEQILISILICGVNKRNILKAWNTLKISSLSVHTKNGFFFTYVVFSYQFLNRIRSIRHYQRNLLMILRIIMYVEDI